ncbi:hypothetical protein DSECCO2_579230 [anaerobic digester metagenome]
MKKIPVLFQLAVIAALFINCSNSKTMEISITSTAFKNDSLIPSRYTCDGANVSPQLSWTNAPENTKSFALICDDPDAPSKTWVHWMVFNIPAETHAIAEGADSVAGAQYGKNDFGKTNYGGPCPPSGTHHYHFKVYALDCMLPLKNGANKKEIEDAMKGHILAQGELVGLYSRKR